MGMRLRFWQIQLEATADIKVLNLDDGIADILSTWAKHWGSSLQEEARRALAASVSSHMEAFAPSAAAVGAATAGQALDSARITREQRDARG